MARKGRGKSAYVVVPVFIFFGLLYHRCIYHAAVSYYAAPLYGVTQPRTTTSSAEFTANKLISESFGLGGTPSHGGRKVITTASEIPAVSVAVPDWQVFVLASPEYSPLSWDEDDPYVCLFEQGDTSPAVPAGALSFPDRSLFKCDYPDSARRRKLTKQPILTRSSSLINFTPNATNSQPPLFQWNFLVYDSITTEDDVVLFVKGVNNRQGINRKPTEFRCVFFHGDDAINAVKTELTSSIQEVFRCNRPELTAGNIKVSLEIVGPNPIIVPTVAFYNPSRHLAAAGNRKSQLCAATVVYNVAKNLKEWVMYHSRIGVERFILYDNNSDDELRQTVKNLVQQGIDITTYFWPWPKTQEAGFSHSTVYANGSCTWMMFTDVDEFLYSKSWDDFVDPSKFMLHSVLPNPETMLHSVLPNPETVAQLSVACLEFGPSNRTSHPPAGVTQGYNCRRLRDNRHKSVVLLDAVDHSLLNVIHHFKLKPGFKTVKVKVDDMVVNHYKYQAWPEFKAKFRRRVSAYVIDWTRQENPNSNDRTPGLGYRPVEPEGWPMRFCEVYDNGLKLLTQRWFGVESPAGYRMAWQSR